MMLHEAENGEAVVGIVFLMELVGFLWRELEMLFKIFLA
jgi:hypothetical protein